MSIVLAVLALAVIIGIASVSESKWKKTLVAFGAKRDLQLTDGGMLRTTSLHGAVDDVPVTVDTYTVRSGDSSTIYSRISIAPRMPDGLFLRREGAFLGKLFKGEDFAIGDLTFDGQVVVRGPTRAVRALLDAPTRAAVADCVSRGITVEDGAIKWVESGFADAATLESALGELLALGRLLSRPADAAALAKVVQTDAPAVALEALRIMPAGPQRDAADADVVTSRDDELVMTAAGRMGAAAAPGVVRVLENVHNARTLRADAMTWLGQHTDASDIARAHLTRPPISTAALAVLLKANQTAPLDVLARLIKQDDASAALAVRAAQQHGVIAEPLLIEALANDAATVARAAAEGLGLIGTPAAVMPLRARIKGLFTNGALESAVVTAIEQIQGRVGVVGGGLSVVDAGAAGRLSETEG